MAKLNEMVEKVNRIQPNLDTPIRFGYDAETTQWVIYLGGWPVMGGSKSEVDRALTLLEKIIPTVHSCTTMAHSY